MTEKRCETCRYFERWDDMSNNVGDCKFEILVPLPLWALAELSDSMTIGPVVAGVSENCATWAKKPDA